MSDVPEGCAHNFSRGPRVATDCGARVEAVVQYSAAGMGACKEHLGAVVLWVLEDGWSVEVFTPEAWRAR